MFACLLTCLLLWQNAIRRRQGWLVGGWERNARSLLIGVAAGLRARISHLRYCHCRLKLRYVAPARKRSVCGETQYFFHFLIFAFSFSYIFICCFWLVSVLGSGRGGGVCVCELAFLARLLACLLASLLACLRVLLFYIENENAWALACCSKAKKGKKERKERKKQGGCDIRICCII